MTDFITASELLTNLCWHHLKPDFPFATTIIVLPVFIRWLDLRSNPDLLHVALELVGNEGSILDKEMKLVCVFYD